MAGARDLFDSKSFLWIIKEFKENLNKDKQAFREQYSFDRNWLDSRADHQMSLAAKEMTELLERHREKFREAVIENLISNKDLIRKHAERTLQQGIMLGKRGPCIHPKIEVSDVIDGEFQDHIRTMDRLNDINPTSISTPRSGIDRAIEIRDVNVKVIGGQSLAENRAKSCLKKYQILDEKLRGMIKTARFILIFPHHRARIVLNKEEYLELSFSSDQVKYFKLIDPEKLSSKDPHESFFKAIDFILQNIKIEPTQSTYTLAEVKDNLTFGMPVPEKSNIMLSTEPIATKTCSSSSKLCLKVDINDIYVLRDSYLTKIDIRYNVTKIMELEPAEYIDFGIIRQTTVTICISLRIEQLCLTFNQKTYTPDSISLSRCYTHSELSSNIYKPQRMLVANGSHVLVSVARFNKEIQDYYCDVHLYAYNTKLRFKQKISTSAIDCEKPFTVQGMSMVDTHQSTIKLVTMVDTINRMMVYALYDTAKHTLNTINVMNRVPDTDCMLDAAIDDNHNSIVMHRADIINALY